MSCHIIHILSNNRTLYTENLTEKLLKLPSLQKCTNKSHRIALDNYIEDVIAASEDASKEFIPYTRAPKNGANKASNRKVIAGWNVLVAPKKDEAKFHYQLWLSANKP